MLTLEKPIRRRAEFEPITIFWYVYIHYASRHYGHRDNMGEMYVQDYSNPAIQKFTGRSDILAFIPAEAGTRFSDPGGMQG